MALDTFSYIYVCGYCWDSDRIFNAFKLFIANVAT